MRTFPNRTTWYREIFCRRCHTGLRALVDLYICCRRCMRFVGGSGVHSYATTGRAVCHGTLSVGKKYDFNRAETIRERDSVTVVRARFAAEK